MKVWIEYPVEPAKLILTWQAPDGQEDRLRWAVGDLENLTSATFRYFSIDELPAHNVGRSSEQLKAAGFRGYPAFTYTPGAIFDSDVLRTFMRRLPPATRADFADYQAYFSIRPKSTLSGSLLLALTEARLPSDGFSLVDPLSPAADLCDAVFEVAGFRYEAGKRDLDLGEELQLEIDPHNAHDPNAVAVTSSGQRIGFVNRLQAQTIRAWIDTRTVKCEVLRTNGRPDAPRAYAKIAVRPRRSELAA